MNLVLDDYQDWLNKAEFNLETFRKSASLYDFVDCCLTLNAMPEWIIATAPAAIADSSTAVLERIRDSNNILDESKIASDIEQKLIFIRRYCNRSKHALVNIRIAKVAQADGTKIPATLPFSLRRVTIGQTELDADIFLQDVINYWKNFVSTQSS